MIKHLYKTLICTVLCLAGGLHLYAADGIIETRYYKLCPGDFITLDTRQTRIYNDTVVYDTVHASEPGGDSTYVYVVSLYPHFEKNESRVIEPGTSITWCDTVLRTGGSYERVYHTIHGCDSIHRMHVTVEVTRSFSLCDGESVTFNGQTYSDAGTYHDAYSADTTYKIIIAKYPTQVYQQTGVLDAMNPYYWQYTDNGVTKTDTVSQAGIYEHITQNPETGCNDIWRLILTKDETTYHFIETETICEDQPFSWHGKTNLNEQGIGQTIHYFDRQKTVSGYDSIYELILTVQPVQRRSQTIPFCGSIEWKGTTYTESQVLTDTLQSVLYSCDSIITTILSRGIPFHYHDTTTITPGSSIAWRGQTITTSGYYEDAYVSHSGCDSVYSLGVGIKENVPQMAIHTDIAAICEGDSYPWRNKNYRESGTFVDTLYKAGSTTEIDSLYVLELTVNKRYELTERVGFPSFPQTYRGIDIPGVGTYTAHYSTAAGCDSIYTIYVDKEILRDIQDATICEGETYSWRGVVRDIAGQYKEVEKDAAGNIIAEHILNLTILPKRETRVTVDICQGSSYTFANQTLTESGIYTHVYHEDGCDSTVILSLNVLSADTVTDVVTLDPNHAYTWPRDHKVYSEAGVYYHYDTNGDGCTVTEVLILTENHVDEVDTTVTACPSELPFEWHGIRAFESGDFQKEEKQADGSYVWYRLHLTVREVAQTSKEFVVCGDVNVSYNGKTYTEAGYFTDYLGCDTVVTIHIIQLPMEVYETNASLGGEHGYNWTFKREGVEVDSIFYEPGTYEFESPNEQTGCNDIWRLILTKDETSYHFVERITICEGEEYSWRGLDNLSGVPGTTHYYDEYKTRTGKDSIYELVLTVKPVLRTMQTKYFCGSIEWNDIVYTESAVVYDTIATTEGCYEIRRTNLDKARDFYSVENWTLVQGDSVQWHGQTIYGDGVFYDRQKTIHGCDSTYELRVEVVAAPPHTNMYIEQMSVCHGDTLQWRGKDIWTGGRYVDTVKTVAQDSIFILNLNVWPSYKDVITRHLYTCGIGASIRYQGQDYWKDTMLLDTLPTLHGCDSIVRVYMHFNTALFLSDTIEITNAQLPYVWNYRLGGEARDTTLTVSGTYIHEEKAEGGCYNREELVLIVYPTYLYEDSIVICETELPYHWQNGPIEHQNDDLSHAVGTVKQYEYRYTTVFNTDSIYRLHLQIDPAPKDTVEIRFCEGEQVKVGDKIYVNIQSDSVYRDTLVVPNPNNGCDSIIYYEIYQYPRKEKIATEVLHPNDTIVWRGDSITLPGWYNAQPDSIDAATGCPIIDRLHVIQDLRETRVICKIDTAEDTHPDKKYPFVWNSPSGHTPDTLYNSGIYNDTVFDGDGKISAFYSLDLTITQPYDTIVYVHGCMNKGALWRDRLYYADTLFVDRVEVDPFDPLQPCDSVFHVHIVMDTIYAIQIDTTLCEYQLPLIVGRVNPDTIWWEGNFQHIGDTTACGCDSIISGHLTIIPKLTHNDSTFVCETFFKDGGVVSLGDTVHPAFLDNDGGKWAGTWEGKWTGVHYTEDTIVWDCDHRYFHHIIMRPSQKVPFDTTYYLCEGDSIQLFWPKTQWVKQDTVYFDTVPMGYSWTDPQHNYSYHREDYLCDSVVRWTVKFVHPEEKDTTAHILLGDSIWWGGAWRYYTGTYDSIGPAKEKNSDSIPCRLSYTLHLIADSIYYFRDTVDICSPANKTHNHIWNTGFKSEFNVPEKDSMFHVVNSLITYDRRDSIYDLFVQFRLIPTTHLYDTICEGDAFRFDIHQDTTTIERYLTKAGIYYDTVPGTNICDSVLILHLYVHNRIPTTHRSVLISDRQAPYIWYHRWTALGTDTMYADTLRASGEYRFLMPSIHGCDSIDSLSLTIHQTHVFRDTIDVCAPINKSLTHHWTTGYTQYYTTPLADDTAFYNDTLETRIQYDSIYVLCVNFHQTYLTEKTDTICEGDSLRFDLHRGTTTIERWLHTRGIYRDTIETRFGCDSVIQLRLFVRDRYEPTHRTVHIPDTVAPYLWTHTWKANGLDKTKTDTLYASGEYSFLMPTIYGCDSIDSLSLFIHKTYRIREDSIYICASETPFTWQDRNDITGTCDLTFHALTTEGYDSIRFVHIEVLPVFKHTVLIDTLCDGDSIRFGLTRQNTPRYLSASGVYYDTLTSHLYGCDSIVELRLNVYPHTKVHRTVNVSVDELPYVWPHIQGGDTIDRDTLRASGEYAYYFTSRFGCDSIDSLSLRVHQTYLYRDTVRICASETPYEWQGIKDIYTTDEYTKYLQTHDGYDSILVRYVEVLPVFKSTILHNTICEGDSLRFGLTKQNLPRFLTTSGVYYDTLTSHLYGCDSIVELRLNVYPRYFNDSTKHIADVDTPYVWIHRQGGVEIARDSLFATGSYGYTYTNQYGCDSIDSLRLVIHPTYVFKDSITICYDQTPYTWWNNEHTEIFQEGIYETGTYIKRLQTHDLYDSTYVRYVRVLPVVKDTIRHAMCRGEGYAFNGNYYTQAGTYNDTLTAENGCDRIITTIITILPTSGSHKTVDIADANMPYVWEHIQWDCGVGRITRDTLHASGEYAYRMENIYGCDSIDSLSLRVHQTYDIREDTIDLCSDATPFTWCDKTNITTSGDYTYYGHTVEGYDSIRRVHINVWPVQYTTIQRTICEGDGYDFQGKLLRTSGEYRDTVKTINGCDSVIILHLNVLKKYYNTVERTIYEGDTVHFEGATYSTAGVYPVRYTSSYGCDSIIELRLTVNRLYDDSISVCSNELPYVWHNKMIYESGIVRDTVYDSENKPSVIGLKVNVLPTKRLEEPIHATICEGDFYKFGSSMLTEQGTYYDTLTAANGCDSIVMLALTVIPVEYKSEVRRIYEGDTVVWHGDSLTTSGIYEYRYGNQYGCINTNQLILTVLKSFNVDTTAVICDTDLPFIWRGIEYNESGDYSLPVSWNDSSRVVKTLHLTVNKSFYGERNISICAGDTFLFNGREYYDSGEFNDTIPSSVGCDSIIKYIISKHPTYDKIFEKHISDKQPYIFHGRELTNSGTYEWTGKTTEGCDSLEHLILTVHPSYFFSDTVDLCKSDSINLPYKWHGYSITTSGKYTDSILTSYGFDSVYQLIINIHPSYFIREKYEIGEGETLKIHGRDISKPAVYYDTLRTIHGCDSIYHIVVNPKGTREFTWNKVICQGEYFDFFGRKITHTGKYTYTSEYKDSIVTLFLTVNPISITEERIVITDRQIPYIHDGHIYEKAGVYSDTLYNAFGCDSIHRLVLVVTERYSDWTPMPLCPGSEIKIDGQTITEAGLYTFLRRSRVTGEMDSIYRVEVYDAPAYDLPVENRVICDGDTLRIGGKTITRAGHYDFALKTTEGCDSLLHFDVKVNPSYHYFTDATIRDYENYVWMGKSYNVEGSYDRTWPTIDDCDSTYTLRLKVIPTQRFITIDTICEGQTYTWRGKDYTTDGYFTDTMFRPETFYSAIYTLQLTVMHPTFITSANVSEICADDKSFDISFTYTGARPTTYSIFFDQLAKNEGFTDVINKPFLGEDRVATAPVPTKTEVVYLDHTGYVRPNRYGMRLVLDNGVCGKSQSDSLSVLVKYPSWIIEQNWNDVVAPLKKSYNGGYEFSQTNWYINGVEQPNNNLGYMQSSRLRDGDEVVMVATRKGENYSVPTCPLIIAIDNTTAYEEPILVYPTRAPRFAARITIEAPQGGEYAIYSSTGMLISSGTLTEGATQVNLPPTCGMYFVRTAHQGDKATHKVVIY